MPSVLQTNNAAMTYGQKSMPVNWSHAWLRNFRNLTATIASNLLSSFDDWNTHLASPHLEVLCCHYHQLTRSCGCGCGAARRSRHPNTEISSARLFTNYGADPGLPGGSNDWYLPADAVPAASTGICYNYAHGLDTCECVDEVRRPATVRHHMVRSVRHTQRAAIAITQNCRRASTGVVLSLIALEWHIVDHI